MAVKPVPEGLRTVTPHLVIKGASDAIEFYKTAFGAEEVNRMPGPDGQTVMHAAIKIGDSMIFLGDEFPDMGGKSPATLQGSPTTIHLYVDDVDAAWKQAVDAGARVTLELDNMFWGDRYGMVVDPFGHQWALASHVEDVSPEDMAKRAGEMFGG